MTEYKTLADDGEFKRVMHIGEDAAHGEGPGGRYYGRITDSKAHFKGYREPGVKGLIPYYGKYPEWMIEQAKRELRDPWYLSVRDCGLKVGQPAASRCRKAGISYDEEEKVQGVIEFCAIQQREVMHRLKMQLTNNLTYQDMIDEHGPEDIHEKAIKIRPGVVFPARTINPYNHIVQEIREEAIISVYDSYGVPSPKEIKRTIRMNMLRPFGALVGSHTLGDVSRASSDLRLAAAEKTVKALDAAIAEFDACVKREWEQRH